ncbi:MAG TPA: maleylacetoacetate isomerase [Nevskiaceae bacterium]|nr:maleylacetoacetate isomerase [Nevskiaceae bacterium]
MLALYSYWRSSASYRVRLGLNLKGLAYEYRPVHLLREGGEQHSPAYRALNPEGRVPLLLDGELRLGQSLAILEYLDERHPQPPLLPADPALRARVRQFALALACDVQPLINLGVLQYLEREFAVPEPARTTWLRHWMQRGLAALEQEIADLPERAALFGDAPGLADCCLVAQFYAARRFGLPLASFPRLTAVEARLQALPAIAAAHPDRQPDAETAAR